jgi:hypothetical protein
LPTAVILPLIAILSVTSEWSQRTGLTTFTLVPHRRRIIAAKAIASITVGILAMPITLAIGALGNLAGAALTRTALVWDASLIECLNFILGSILRLLIGFMLGVLIRASLGAIVAYFVYSFLLPGVLSLLAASQNWFRDLQPWIDLQCAQGALVQFNGPLAGQQWANIAASQEPSGCSSPHDQAQVRREVRSQIDERDPSGPAGWPTVVMRHPSSRTRSVPKMGCRRHAPAPSGIHASSRMQTVSDTSSGLRLT